MAGTDVTPPRPPRAHQALQPGALSFTPSGTPYAEAFGDVYHAQAGAWAQARHVFLQGNGLPERWSGRSRFVIAETGFGLGNNFLATWSAWRADPQRCQRLVFMSVEKHPLTRDDLRRALAEAPEPTLSQALIAHWPPLTPGLHLLEFEAGRVQLALALGDVQRWLTQWVANVDAFYLDGFSPAVNADMWDTSLLKRLGRLAAEGATAATWSVARSVRDGLAAAGFQCERQPGFAGKREMLTARYAPHHRPAPPPAALRTPSGERRALIIGAGLAGCAAARALGQQGWDCQVLGRASILADGASGNVAGLFHGTFQRDDGPHARWHRAGALHMARWARPRVRSGQLTGQVDGLIRLEADRPAAQAHQQLIDAGLPPTYIEWVTPHQAWARWQLHLPSGGWFYPDAGWLSPAQVCQAWMQEARAEFVPGVEISQVRQVDTTQWEVQSTDGRVWQAPVVVVAAALNSSHLIAAHPSDLPDHWLGSVRGQTTLVPAHALLGTAPLPTLPLAGAGYAVSLPDGAVLCGATSQRGDDDPSVRPDDHQHNLQQYARLTGQADLSPRIPIAELSGRTAWRTLTRDRLPAIGPLPRAASPCTPGLPLHRRERWTSAHGGLYTLTGLASRGLSTALLSAEVLASWICGSPCPVERDLRDAVDVARLSTSIRGNGQTSTPPDGSHPNERCSPPA